MPDYGQLYGQGLSNQGLLKDRTGEYLQQERYAATREQKAAANQDKVLNNLIKGAASYDKGMYDPIVIPDLAKDHQEFIQKLFDLKKANPNNYIPAAQQAYAEFEDKRNLHAARSANLKEQRMKARQELTPEGGEVMDTFNQAESSGKGYSGLIDMLNAKGIKERSGGYVDYGERSGITLMKPPKPTDFEKEFKTAKSDAQNKVVSSLVPYYSDPTKSKLLETIVSKIPDDQAEKKQMRIEAAKNGVTLDPDIRTKEDILNEKWNNPELQARYRFDKRGDHLSESELKQRFFNEGKKYLAGTEEQRVVSKPKPDKPTQTKPDKPTQTEMNKQWKVEGNKVFNAKTAWTRDVTPDGTETIAASHTDPSENKPLDFILYKADAKTPLKTIKAVFSRYEITPDGNYRMFVTQDVKTQQKMPDGKMATVTVPKEREIIYSKDNASKVNREFGLNPIDVREKITGSLKPSTAPSFGKTSVGGGSSSHSSSKDFTKLPLEKKQELQTQSGATNKDEFAKWLKDNGYTF